MSLLIIISCNCSIDNLSDIGPLTDGVNYISKPSE